MVTTPRYKKQIPFGNDRKKGSCEYKKARSIANNYERSKVIKSRGRLDS